MRRSQSSNKEISRGLEDEVKDYISQPLRSLNLFTELLKRLSRQNEEPITLSDGLKKEFIDSKKYMTPESYSWRQFLTPDQVSIATRAKDNRNKPFFNSKIIQSFAQELKGDSFECYKHMYDVRYLSNDKVFEHYSKIYSQHKTVPLVFLSVVKTDEKKVNAIYLWQFNELCPINRKTSRMEVDCPPKKQILVPHNSILLLAKFVTSEQEELLDGQFLSDTRIVIKSRVSSTHLRFREYDMMDLRELVRVNPYQGHFDIRFYCASKLDVCLEDDAITCDLSRIRRLMEIDLLEYHSAHKQDGVQSLPMFIKTACEKIESVGTIGLELPNSLFGEIYSIKMSSYTVLIDRGLKKMILFKKDSLKIIDLSTAGDVNTIYENHNDVFYLLNKEGKVFKVDASGNQICEDLEMNMDTKFEVKFLRANETDYLVYLEGTKFYKIALNKGEIPELLFDVEKGQVGEGEEVQRLDRKLIWEVVQDKIAFFRGGYLQFYDVTRKKFEKKELEKEDFLAYKSSEWQLLAKNSKLFVIIKSGDFLKIKTLAWKSKSESEEKEEEDQVSQEEEDQVSQENSETQTQGGPVFIDECEGELKKSESSLFIQATGPNDEIIFLRVEEPYLKDGWHKVFDTPNYLFSSFVFPHKKQNLQQQHQWESYYARQEREKAQKQKEEYQKKLEEEEKEFEEYEERKTRVNKHLKDGRVMKDSEKYEEERKENMADLRKAIIKSGKEEGADRVDKRLKDVKDEYMGMYQDLKKEKKQQIKEKEKTKNKDRKSDRGNKREY